MAKKKKPTPADEALGHMDLALCAAIAADQAIQDIHQLRKAPYGKAFGAALDEAKRYGARAVEQLHDARSDVASAMVAVAVPSTPRRTQRRAGRRPASPAAKAGRRR